MLFACPIGGPGLEQRAGSRAKKFFFKAKITHAPDSLSANVQHTPRVFLTLPPIATVVGQNPLAVGPADQVPKLVQDRGNPSFPGIGFKLTNRRNLPASR